MAATRVVTALRMPHELADEVQAYADRRGISLNAAVCIMVTEKLDELRVRELEFKERELQLQNS